MKREWRILTLGCMALFSASRLQAEPGRAVVVPGQPQVIARPSIQQPSLHSTTNININYRAVTNNYYGNNYYRPYSGHYYYQMAYYNYYMAYYSYYMAYYRWMYAQYYHRPRKSFALALSVGGFNLGIASSRW